MSIKLLLNLVECVAKIKPASYQLLLRILDTFVNKFSSLRKQIPDLLARGNQTASEAASDTPAHSPANVAKGPFLTPITLI